MTNKLDIITRGVDSSGRPLKNTRQQWQFFDRLNAGVAGGMLVMIQGGWSFADASANTHGKGMCDDFRIWNLSLPLRGRIVKQGRDWMGTMWVRLEADGFDPHMHNNLMGDSPATQAALDQIPSYKAGLNGLANQAQDRNQYRPSTYHAYHYIEEPDVTPEQAKQLTHIESMLETTMTRDQRDRQREKDRFQRLVSNLGAQADQLTVIINNTKDDATKTQLKAVKERILLQLKNDPDVTQVDNPSDDALGEMNMG